MNSDNHPISILYRLRRRTRQTLERHYPRRWLTRAMSKGLGTVKLSATCVDKRLQRFAGLVPFADVDFEALLTAEEQTRLLELSDRVQKHRFDLLGSGPVQLDDNIDWHRDFVTRFRWSPHHLYSRAAQAATPGSDIKRPWELSRCQHLPQLGIAWHLTGAEIYFKEYQAQVDDWIRQNRVGSGVNWACSMEVAIRAVNWLAGYSLLEQALQGDTEQSFKKRLTASLWEHASFIRTHLEWNGPFASRRANHFLADLTGLFTLGVFFADTTRGRRWLRFAQHNLEVEIRRQVLEDGFHFECSTSYQRLCLEMLLWCWSLGSRAGVPFSDTFRDRLGRMQSCVRACTRPDGLVPVCGDNDDGRLLFCGLNAINDHRYLWPQPPPEAYNADVALLQGDETPQFDTASDLKEFPLAGYYILRSHEYYLLIRAGALAHNGTHAHCDQLGFELALPGGPVFVDRGSYVYTSDIEQRNRYRSSRAHNVLTLNGAEQNRQTGVVFGLADDTRTQVLETGADSLKARHTGFKSLEREHVSHTRTFQLSSSGRTLAISDEVEGILQGDRLEWYFQLAPGIAVEIGDGRAVLNRDGQPVCRLEFPAEMQLHSERFDHSPTYGVLQEAITLTLTHAIEHAVSQYVTRFLITWEKR